MTRGRRPLRRFLLGSLTIAVCTTVALSTLAIGAVSQIATDLGSPQIHSSRLARATPGAPETILVIGDDHDGPLVHGVHLLHADTFMLVRMDPQQRQTSIMSIPRDLLVSFRWKGALYPDQKFNTTYAVGGPLAVLHVAQQTLPRLTINHIVDFNFSAFIGVVDAIGCVYVDVDHRYLNETDQTYSKINLEPGYQRLCAANALSYVRYRHNDSDFVRVARQADFIRQAKEQLGLFTLVSKYDQIAKALGHAIRTDIGGSSHEIYQLLQLIAYSSVRPIRHVPFQYSNGQFYVNGQEAVTSTPQLIRASEDDFLNAPVPAAAPGAEIAKTRRRRHHHHRTARLSSTPAGLSALPSAARSRALPLLPQVPFPVLMPTLQTLAATPNDYRAYTLPDEQGHLHLGYRVDFSDGSIGNYYGIEGMNWTNPPLFANPNATETIGGRTYLFIDDGSRYHDIGWRVGGTLYWVSNTLLEDLSNSQMLALAESASAVG